MLSILLAAVTKTKLNQTFKQKVLGSISDKFNYGVIYPKAHPLIQYLVSFSDILFKILGNGLHEALTARHLIRSIAERSKSDSDPGGV
jgi:hypothetical protein